MTRTREIKLYGIVQGVGMRPHVAKMAQKRGLFGTVCNMGSYVRILLQGDALTINEFVVALQNDAPARAEITNLTEQTIYVEEIFSSFGIVDSAPEKGDVLVSPDIALCDECKRELFDENNKRYLHPFINCTLCGPRLTIMKNVPYDRAQTTMSQFSMCPECEAEYYDSTDRRYDAQPVCCNECGPTCYILEKTGERGRCDHEAITEFRRQIAGGHIGAIKGIGGFHLCCDATNEHAVQRLRDLKRRPSKPLAVMAKDFDALQKEVSVTSRHQEEIVNGPRKPIVLLQKKAGGRAAWNVAPNNSKLGIMLPYAPLQELIFTYPDDVVMPELLVMTSGNVSGAPIACSDKDAIEQIGAFCDIILSHDREILTRADDSVMDFLGEEPYMIRRSRGYAPLPVKVSNGRGMALGIGGELKNTFSLAKGKMVYPSAYLADMEDSRSIAALKGTLERMEALLEIQPEAVCYDLHPRYNTSNVAEELSIKRKIKLQHHYAHILSCMAENDYASKVIGVGFDGTGYGDDGTIWGGEILLCDLHEYNRRGHLSGFYQVGGDSASKEAWRNAICMLSECERNGLIEDAATIARMLELGPDSNIKNILTLTKGKMGGVMSTSAGRLFDAIAAVLGICKVSCYEGEAACLLQYYAERYQMKYGDTEPEVKIANKTDSLGVVIPSDEIFAYILKQKIKGIDIERIAYDFHVIMARNICDAVLEISREEDVHTVALSGGVFQNTLLTSFVKDLLSVAEMNVLVHRLIPPNDGGIGLGQAYYAINN